MFYCTLFCYCLWFGFDLIAPVVVCVDLWCCTLLGSFVWHSVCLMFVLLVLVCFLCLILLVDCLFNLAAARLLLCFDYDVVLCCGT